MLMCSTGFSCQIHSLNFFLKNNIFWNKLFRWGKTAVGEGLYLKSDREIIPRQLLDPKKEKNVDPLGGAPNIIRTFSVSNSWDHCFVISLPNLGVHEIFLKYKNCRVSGNYRAGRSDFDSAFVTFLNKKFRFILDFLTDTFTCQNQRINLKILHVVEDRWNMNVLNFCSNRSISFRDLNFIKVRCTLRQLDIF